MPDVEQESVTEEVAAPEIENQQPIEPEGEEAPKSESQAKPKGKDENMARMRQSLDDLKRKNQELQAALEHIKQPAPKPEPDELETLSEDDFVNRKQAEKLIEKRVSARVDAALKAMKVETREGLFAANTADYKQVVNQENFDALFQDVPELQPVLKRAYDLAMQGEDIDPVALSYKLLKKFGANPGETDMSKKASEALQKNATKPLSSNSIKSSALTEAHKYINKPSKEEATRLFKETQEAARARR